MIKNNQPLSHFTRNFNEGTIVKNNKIKSKRIEVGCGKTERQDHYLFPTTPQFNLTMSEETFSRSPSSVALSYLSSDVIRSSEKNRKKLNEELKVQGGGRGDDIQTNDNNTGNNTTPTENAALVEITWKEMKDLIQANKDEKSLSLAEFLQVLPSVIRLMEESESSSRNTTSPPTAATTTSTNQAAAKSDAIGNLFQCIDWNNKSILQPFLYQEPSKNYTRNLISTDNQTYTLLALCWNPGKYSPIHDHPCDGCWMSICEGCIHEVRYGVNAAEDSFEVLDESMYHGTLYKYLLHYLDLKTQSQSFPLYKI